MSRIPIPRNAWGFTLTELAVVLAIVALLIGGLLMPLAEQDNLRRTQETRKILADASEALLGFAAAQGRLPCPASDASSGIESFCPNGGPDANPCGDATVITQAHGRCSHPLNGFLPAATLGISPVDDHGQARDAWNGRIRYAVTTQYVAVRAIYPFTAPGGMSATGLANLASTLSICATSTGITAANCGTATKLTDKAPAVLLSIGRNAPTGGVGNDEVANLNGDAVFVGHEPTPSTAANGEFDDLVVWLSPNILYNRMIAAGRLP